MSERYCESCGKALGYLERKNSICLECQEDEKEEISFQKLKKLKKSKMEN